MQEQDFVGRIQALSHQEEIELCAADAYKGESRAQYLAEALRRNTSWERMVVNQLPSMGCESFAAALSGNGRLQELTIRCEESLGGLPLPVISGQSAISFLGH